MKGTLGILGWLTLAFVGVLIVVPIVGQCNDGASNLPCVIISGFVFLLAIVGSSLSGLILGITACRAARRSQRWGWFSAFLLLTVLLYIGVLIYFLVVFGRLNLPLSASLSILPLVAPPLALVAAAFVYRREEA